MNILAGVEHSLLGPDLMPVGDVFGIDNHRPEGSNPFIQVQGLGISKLCPKPETFDLRHF
jgi:hypothetical protein